MDFWEASSADTAVSVNATQKADYHWIITGVYSKLSF